MYLLYAVAFHFRNITILYYSACRRRGGVLNSPRFCFFCQCRKLGYRSWVIPLCILLSEPVSSRLLNSISTKLFHQNKQFNMYTTTSKQQEDSTCKNWYPKCFITTNSITRSDKSFRSFSAVFPLQLVDIDQTYDILCLCSTEISQQNTLFNM